MEKLGTNLKSLLKKYNLSENELARRTGISQQIINRILLGQNTNPKLATLIPLANYFMISISELIGDNFQGQQINIINKNNRFEIPVIDWITLEEGTLEKAISTSIHTFMSELAITGKVFAINLIDSSMEPKFSRGSLLIFDASIKPQNGDFILIHSKKTLVFRQLIIKKSGEYKKALNPDFEDFQTNTLQGCIIGTLIQSRTNFLAF